jgi:hypothetical protein
MVMNYKVSKEGINMEFKKVDCNLLVASIDIRIRAMLILGISRILLAGYGKISLQVSSLI